MSETEKKLHDALATLKAEKPNDRTDLDRRYAIAITELEKVIAYYTAWIVHAENPPLPTPPNPDLTPIAKKVVEVGGKYIHPFPEKTEKKESADQ